MNILKKEEIVKLPDRTSVTGYVLVQSYSVMPQKNGGQYIGGKLQAAGDLGFKAWSSTLPTSAYMKMLGEEDFRGKICFVDATVNYFGGEYSLILNSIKAVEQGKDGLNKSDFFQSVYDENIYMRDLRALLKKYCSPNAILVFELLMKDHEERFKLEFAAVSHHDNCRSGLLAHSSKVTRLATLIKMYPAIMKKVSLDLLFVGTALHDIGKIEEYSDGSISEIGVKLSHHTMGVLMVNEHREKITELMGEDFFYGLLSIIEQHHGQYAEHPRTVAAYVIHLLDAMEANLQSLNDLILNSVGSQVQFDGFKLS